MDRIEQTVRRTNLDQKEKDVFRYRIRLALAIAFSALAVLLLISMFASANVESGSAFTTDSLIMLIPIFISSVIAAIFFVIKDNAIIEYDYAVEDDVFTVAKIKNLSSRKTLLNIKVKNFKKLERYSRTELKKMKNKVTDCSLNSQKDKYFLFYDDNGEVSVLIFEPNDMFRDMIKKEFAHPSSDGHHRHHHSSSEDGSEHHHHHHHHHSDSEHTDTSSSDGEKK